MFQKHGERSTFIRPRVNVRNGSCVAEFSYSIESEVTIVTNKLSEETRFVHTIAILLVAFPICRAVPIRLITVLNLVLVIFLYIRSHHVAIRGTVLSRVTKDYQCLIESCLDTLQNERFSKSHQRHAM